jgi:hypothetical protein
MINSTIGRLIGLRPVGMAAVAVFAGGGLALAAGSTATHAPAKPHHATHAAGAATKYAATPHPSLHGLCHAYQAGVANHHGKKLSNPAFSVLVSAAHGRAGLSGYCTGLVGHRAAHPDADDRGEARRHTNGKHVPPGLAKKHHH